jgi:hypothetical protein
MMTPPAASMVCRPRKRAAIADAVSTATMSRPSMATAPASITRRLASTVTTMPLVTISETARGAEGWAAWSAANAAANRTNVRTMK